MQPRNGSVVWGSGLMPPWVPHTTPTLVTVPHGWPGLSGWAELAVSDALPAGCHYFTFLESGIIMHILGGYRLLLFSRQQL